MGTVVDHGERDRLVSLPARAQLASAAPLERLFELGPEARNEQLPLAAHRIGHVAFKLAGRRNRHGDILILRHRCLQVRERRPDGGSEPLVDQRQAFPQNTVGFRRIHVARAVNVHDELRVRGSIGGGISGHSMFRMHRPPMSSTTA